MIICSLLSHYLTTGQLVLSLNSLTYLSWKYYSPHFTEPVRLGYQPLRFFLMHNISEINIQDKIIHDITQRVAGQKFSDIIHFYVQNVSSFKHFAEAHQF